CDGDDLDLRSFPTRRSSDLAGDGEGLGGRVEVNRLSKVELDVEVAGAIADAQPIGFGCRTVDGDLGVGAEVLGGVGGEGAGDGRSEEHTSELQSRENLVCRL